MPQLLGAMRAADGGSCDLILGAVLYPKYSTCLGSDVLRK